MRICAFAADAIVLVLTCVRFWPQKREGTRFGYMSMLPAVFFLGGTHFHSLRALLSLITVSCEGTLYFV